MPFEIVLPVNVKHNLKRKHFFHIKMTLFSHELILTSINLNKNQQGSTTGVHFIHMYAYFYWHVHNFGHTYVDTYAQFSL